MKTCPYCGNQNSDDSQFCTECGKPIPQGRICPHCGACVNDDDAFCSNCGKKVDEQPASDTSKSLQKKCPNCGAHINEGDMYCMECGKKINDITAPSSPVHAQRLCPNCKNQLDEDDVFCPHCGIKPRVAEPCVESNKVEENVNSTKITTEPIKEIVTSDERPSSTVSSEQPTLLRTSNQEEAKSHEKETEHIEGISSWAKYKFHIISAIILLLLILIVGGWYMMSNKPSIESTRTETVEAAHHNFNPNQTLHHHFTGSFTDNLGTYPIELDFKTTNGNADDVIYKNVTLGGKIRMTCTKFGEDEILFEGKDGNNLFTINIHPDGTDRFVGIAKDGKKTLEVKMKAECSHSSKSSGDIQLIQEWYDFVLGKKYTKDGVIDKYLSNSAKEKLSKDDDGSNIGVCRYWLFRTAHQEAKDKGENIVESITSDGGGWYEVKYLDMGWNGVTKVRVSGGQIVDYKRDSSWDLYYNE